MKKILLLITLFITAVCFGQTYELAEEFYENGLPKVIKTFKESNDKYELVKSISLYENGQKEKENTYKNGIPNGKWTEWHNNGEKSKEVTYKDGVKNGNWTYWYENGQIKEKGTSMRGKSYIGSWEKQIEEGEFFTLSFFENGTFTGGEDEVNGIYTISDNEITFIDDECDEEEGVYSYLTKRSIISAFDSSGNERVIRGQQLTFILISDGCDRNEVIPGIWTKK